MKTLRTFLITSFFIVGISLAHALNAPANLRTDGQAWDDDKLNSEIIISLGWDDLSDDETGFVIEQSINGAAFTRTAWPMRDRESLVGVRLSYASGATEYRFRIRSYLQTGRTRDESTFSEPSNTLVLVSLFPPRRSLSVSLGAEGGVDLEWQDLTDLETGYKIERSDDGGENFSEVGRITPPYTIITNAYNREYVTHHDDGPFSQGITYTYRVRAYKEGVGDSEASNTDSVAPADRPAPCNLIMVHTLEQPGVTQVRFGKSNDVSGYRIYRSLDGQNWEINRTLNANPNSRQYDYGLSSNTAYYYKVVPFNVNGEAENNIVKKIVMPNTNVSANATVWYVDSQVTGGMHTGESWANAWPNITSINWPAIKPGDTILISGGPSGLTYNDFFFVPVAGERGRPVTIKVAQETGHNGLVKLTEGIAFTGDWVTLNGAKSDVFPNNIPAKDIRRYVNDPNENHPDGNINLDITASRNIGGFNNAVTMIGGYGSKVFWVYVHDAGSELKDDRSSYVSGIGFNRLPPDGPTPECEAGYVLSRWNKSDGVHLYNGRLVDYGGLKIHHSVIEQNGDDGIEVGAGVDVFNSFVGESHPTHHEGHPDTFQSGGGYIRIYNNELVHTHNSTVFFSITNRSDAKFLLYGNLIYSKRDKEEFGGVTIMSWKDDIPDTTATWTTLVADNNTIVNYGSAGIHATRYGGNLGHGLVTEIFISDAYSQLSG